MVLHGTHALAVKPCRELVASLKPNQKKRGETRLLSQFPLDSMVTDTSLGSRASLAHKTMLAGTEADPTTREIRRTDSVGKPSDWALV